MRGTISVTLQYFSVQLPYSLCEMAFSKVGLFLDTPFPRIGFQKKRPIEDYSAKIDTPFMTKTAEKPYPLGPHMPISPIQGSAPPREKTSQRL